ncbi:hypothetical protein MG293_001303 [Ovis ammon polii]|uniref:Uncharacterized protein n=1 Tax=Ovis ammon polii TaxID=230172 RepID=A0AAD4UKQ6_OVIAM|nr:hypothetical protein MG293_001303 [Ovis ammon polii]
MYSKSLIQFLKRVEGHALIFSCKNSKRTPKVKLTAEQPLTKECWLPPKKDAPYPKAKEKPQQDGGLMNEYMWEDELECARVKVHRADIQQMQTIFYTEAKIIILKGKYGKEFLVLRKYTLRVIQRHVGFGIVLLSFVHMVVLHETAALGHAPSPQHSDLSSPRRTVVQLNPARQPLHQRRQRCPLSPIDMGHTGAVASNSDRGAVESCKAEDRVRFSEPYGWHPTWGSKQQTDFEEGPHSCRSEDSERYVLEPPPPKNRE